MGGSDYDFESLAAWASHHTKVLCGGNSDRVVNPHFSQRFEIHTFVEKAESQKNKSKKDGIFFRFGHILPKPIQTHIGSGFLRA